MKKLFDKENVKLQRSLIFLSVVALVCCIGVVNSKIQTNKSLNVSAGYENYEQAEMEQHNGDVLVDSLNLKSVEGSSKTASAEEMSASENEEKNGDASGDEKVSADDNKAAVVTSDDANEIENTDAYFREARETLTYDRNEMISMLTDTIETSEEGSEKSSAAAQKEKIVEYMNMEKSIENLIRNKGYTDAFVIITDRSVNVTVQAEELNDSDVAKILDIVMRETSRPADDVVIQAKSS